MKGPLKNSQPQALTLVFSSIECRIRVERKRLFVNEVEVHYRNALNSITRDQCSDFPWEDGYGKFAYMMQGESCEFYGAVYPEPVCHLDLWALEIVDCFAWLLLHGSQFPTKRPYRYTNGIWYGDTQIFPSYLSADDRRSRRIKSVLDECKYVGGKAYEVERRK